MEVLRNGKFTININAKTLARGLRRTASNPRDSFGMINLSSLIGKDSVLQTIPELSALITTEITDSFPYPQLFVLANYILICDSTKIYEYDGSLNLKYTVAEAGLTWKVVDYIEYLLLTNGVITVVRNASSGTYSEETTIPTAKVMANYNGQLFLGGISS